MLPSCPFGSLRAGYAGVLHFQKYTTGMAILLTILKSFNEYCAMVFSSKYSQLFEEKKFTFPWKSIVIFILCKCCIFTTKTSSANFLAKQKKSYSFLY